MHGELEGEFGGDGRGMGDDDEDALHILLQVGEEAEDVPGGGFVEVTGGFVAEEEFGVADEGAGDGDALFFAAGELGGEVVDAGGEADAVDEFLGADDEAVFAFADEGGGEDVFQDGALGEEAMVLEDEADAGVTEAGLFGLFEGPGLDVVEEELAGGGGIEEAEDVEEGAFAGAGGAHDGEGVAEMEVEVDGFEDGDGSGWGVVSFGDSPGV